MGRYGEFVIDADGHGGEPLDWRRRIPKRFESQMRAYVAEMVQVYQGLPGGGMRADGDAPALEDEGEFGLNVPMRQGMYDPAPRLADMDLEGIDVAVLYPPGSGEEWALGDADFSEALCQTLNDARAEYVGFAPDRLKFVAKLPMIDPERAARELERCVSEHGAVGMVTATHVREHDLSNQRFDPVWETASRLGVAVCTHGGGQAPGQSVVLIDRFDTRLGIHAVTHPVGAMQAVYHFTVGGVLARFPTLRVGFMEAGVGWLPFWLERLDEHWELMPEQAPLIDRKPSLYFVGRCFLTTEPGEKMVGYLGEALSPDIICYSSDYCHFDCDFPESVQILDARSDLKPDYKTKLFAGNAARLYNLAPEREGGHDGV